MVTTNQSRLGGFQNNKKCKYTQDWPAYDKAKRNQEELFKLLLTELLSATAAIYMKSSKGRGRPSYPLRDVLFCTCMKIYYNKDYRNVESKLKELEKLGHLEKVPNYATISRFMKKVELDEILDSLILFTASFLNEIEEVGAIDSSGFSTSQFDRWFEHKWGAKKTQRVWRKAHIGVGVKTNIIIKVNTTKGTSADNKEFESILRVSADTLGLKEFTGDMAYSARVNFELASKLGLMLYVPFKRNATGKTRGSFAWKNMFHYFQNNIEEFMRHYHKRSNVETAFSMIKKRFGSDLKTKGFISQSNEIKLKCLCHNICVLIQEYFELGLEIDLLQNYQKRYFNM